jgi:argininosuccinate lyase
MPFSPEYVRLVLDQNFKDARELWLDPLLAIHEAHLVMLTSQGIVDAAAARAIRSALNGLDRRTLTTAPYEGADEDLYFYIDRRLHDACGAEAAGQLHTARSRNDIDMTMYRMRVRAQLLRVAEATIGLRRTWVAMAGDHRDALFAAHTHTQPAQPTTLAHYLLAGVEQLERDTTRILAAYVATNQCPLGACAITGTGFPIDRELTSRLLGFDRPTGNTYGSIAAVDYLLEAANACATLLVGLGRIAQDLLLWSTAEVGYLRLADGFVQVSSIMPQKRNPVAIEHARALSSRGVAELGAITHVVHNTPFGDVVDTEDDLQPLVASGFTVASRAVELMTAAMSGATFDRARMRARAGGGWVTATELADTLVREHGVAFVAAHAITSELVRRVPSGAGPDLSPTLEAISRDYGHPVVLTTPALERLLSPDHFVEVRQTAGGPAGVRIDEALAQATSAIRDHASTIARFHDRLAAADVARKRALADL